MPDKSLGFMSNVTGHRRDGLLAPLLPSQTALKLAPRSAVHKADYYKPFDEAANKHG